MKRIIVSTAIGMAVAGFQVSALASGEPAALKAGGCTNCHELDKKKVGPAFKDVSAKYKGKKVDEVLAGMKGKPVHKGVLQKTDDAALNSILEWVQKQ